MNIVDALENEMLDIPENAPWSIYKQCITLVNTLSRNGAFVYQSHARLTYSENTQTGEQTLINAETFDGPVFVVPIGTLGDLYERICLIRGSATATWSGLGKFLLKLLLCILSIHWVNTSNIVWDFLQNMDNYLIASVVLVVFIILTGLIIPKDKGMGAKISICVLAYFVPAWLFYRCVYSMDLNVQLLLWTFSLVAFVWFLFGFRMGSDLIHNLPVLNTKKHLRDKAEYTLLRKQLRAKSVPLLRRVKIAKQTAGLSKKKKRQEYKEDEMWCYYLMEYYTTLTQ